MNDTLGPELYARLTGGRTINKWVMENGALVESPHFNELFRNHDAYVKLYASIGFQLILEQDFYFVRDRSVDPHREVAMRIAALIQILSRRMAFIPLHADAILDSHVGLPRHQIVEMNKVDEVQEILKACGMRLALIDEVSNVLVGRDIAYWNQRDALVLTDSGRFMFNQLFDVDPVEHGISDRNVI